MTLNLYTIQAQNLKKQPLNNEDIKRGVLARYEFIATDSYGYVGVTLFKTGRYFYKTETFSRSSFSEGTWVMKKDELILTSGIKKNDLPVKLQYIKDVSLFQPVKIGKQPGSKPGMENFLQGQNPGSGAPKAYLDCVLFEEEQFKLVNSSSGFVPVPVISGTQEKVLLQANSGNEVEMPKNGYLYVFVSNESKGNV